MMKGIISTYLDKSFERYCRDLVKRSHICTDVGRWWGTVPVMSDGIKVTDSEGKVVTEDADIDVVAVIHRGNDRIDLFGECKFMASPAGMVALNKLMERVTSLNGHFNHRYAIFSISGLTEELEEYASENNILLFGPDVLTYSAPVPEI